MSGVDKHPASFRDPEGFIAIEEGLIYRYLSSDAADRFDQLFANGVMAKLIEAGLLIGTERAEAPASVEGYDTRVLKHDVLDFQSFPWEWSFEMRRQAAVTTANLLAAALPVGYILKDGTPLNLAFHQGRMVWFDVLSLTPVKPKDLWVGYRQFCQMQLFPLMVESLAGMDGNAVLRGNLEGMSADDAAATLGWRRAFKPGVLQHALLQALLSKQDDGARGPDKQSKPTQDRGLNVQALAALAKSYRKVVAKLPSPRQRSGWRDYTATNTYDQAMTEKKMAVVGEFINQAKPNQLVDLGCNTGLYSRLAAERCDRVIALDADGGCIDALVTQTDTDLLKKIAPVVANLLNPSPGHGWMGQESKPLIERIASDALIGLALIHHLCIGGNVPLAQFVDLLAAIAPTGIVEWVAKDDPMVVSMLSTRADIFDSYTEAHFRTALEARFSRVVRHEIGSNTRLLYEFST